MKKIKRKIFKPKEYIIVNKQEEAYVGMMYGSLVWSQDWNEAKPLHKENTTWVLQNNPGTEIIEL
jgi:hypothetical protein